MTPPPETLRPLLETAAELRAAGSSWEAIAKGVGRQPATVRRWPSQYPEAWSRAFSRAEGRQLADAGAEAVLVLRQLLRSDDDKVRRDVARTLTALRAGRRKPRRRDPPTPGGADDAARLADFLRNLDDVQVQSLLGDLGSARPA